MGRSAAHLPIPGPGGSGIASDSLTVVTTISHHYGLPSSLRPPGADAAKTASPSSTENPAATPNATATAPDRGAASARSATATTDAGSGARSAAKPKRPLSTTSENSAENSTTASGYANYTVRQATGDWLANGLDGRSAKTIKKHQNVLEPILTVIGARKLRSLTAGDVRQALSAIAAGLLQRSSDDGAPRAQARDPARRRAAAAVSRCRSRGPLATWSPAVTQPA